MARPHDGVYRLESVFDEAQCAALIAWSEAEGLAPRGGPDEAPAFARCAEPERLPAFVWPRLTAALGAAGLRLAGAPRIAVIDRFDAGQRLLPAVAGGEGPDGLAVVVPLNDGCAGGEAVCYPAAGPQLVVLRAGAGMAFPAVLTYEELPVRTGPKYVLRAVVACQP